MNNDNGHTEAAQSYAEAVVAHYTTKDLREAMEHYKRIMATHPNDPITPPGSEL